MAQILDGKVIRDKIAQDLEKQIKEALRARGPLGRRPKLVIVQVGDLPQSNTYIRQKVLFGQKIGATVELQKLPSEIYPENLESIIQNLNSDPSVHGIIIQMPISENLKKGDIVEAISPRKDVDGQTAVNIKKLIESDPTGFVPATTKGILTMLEYYKIPVIGKHVVVIGRSSLVGKPTALAMLNQNATVTVCHSKTRNLAQVTKTADILIVAAGKPKLIAKNHVAPNQVVVDVGINILGGQKLEDEVSGRKLVGDVDFDQVSKIVTAISPVPGGIGPLTVASLFQNLLEAYKNQDA